MTTSSRKDSRTGCGRAMDCCGNCCKLASRCSLKAVCVIAAIISILLNIVGAWSINLIWNLFLLEQIGEDFHPLLSKFNNIVMIIGLILSLVACGFLLFGALYQSTLLTLPSRHADADGGNANVISLGISIVLNILNIVIVLVLAANIIIAIVLVFHPYDGVIANKYISQSEEVPQVPSVSELKGANCDVEFVKTIRDEMKNNLGKFESAKTDIKKAFTLLAWIVTAFGIAGAGLGTAFGITLLICAINLAASLQNQIFQAQLQNLDENN